MAFVQPNYQDPRHAPGRSRFRGLGALGQLVYCMGSARVGGNYTQSGSTLLLTPDDDPGTTWKILNPPWGDEVGKIVGLRGPSSRVAIAGTWLSDGSIVVTDGWGLLQANEPYTSTFNPDAPCPPYLDYPEAPEEIEEAAETQEVPPEPWSGSQVATIQYSAATGAVTVYGEDGFTYTVDVSGTATPVLEDLRGPAPQGTRLVLEGAWDPSRQLVSVEDWYIEALGEGTQKYGVSEEGNVVEQSFDVPSTDWPGGIPSGVDPAAALEDIGLDPTDYGLQPTSAGAGGASNMVLWGLALAGAALAYDRGWFR